MNLAISSAVSGMNRSASWLTASASAIALSGAQYSSARIEPVRAAVRAPESDIKAERPGLPASSYGRIFAPQATFADAWGMVSMPDVDLVQAMTDRIRAQAAFKANAATLSMADKMTRSLLELVV